jgi:hypothetical protein
MRWDFAEDAILTSFVESATGANESHRSALLNALERHPLLAEAVHAFLEDGGLARLRYLITELLPTQIRQREQALLQAEIIQIQAELRQCCR